MFLYLFLYLILCYFTHTILVYPDPILRSVVSWTQWTIFKTGFLIQVVFVSISVQRELSDIRHRSGPVSEQRMPEFNVEPNLES